MTILPEKSTRSSADGIIEEKLEELIDLSSSIKSMTTEIKTMTKEIEKMGKRLETLEDRDGETWRTVVSHVVTAVVGAVICYIFAQIGM